VTSAELTARYPEIDMLAEEDLDASPWSCALDRSGFHVIVAMLDDKAAEVVPVVLQLAEKYGLVCFDPQAMKVHLPSHLRRPARGTNGGGSLHIICMDERELLPEYQVGFEDYRSSGGAIKMAQILGEEDLFNFLTADVGVEPATVESTLKELRAKGQASIPDLALFDEDLIVLGLR
jgi:hypothetical protein